MQERPTTLIKKGYKQANGCKQINKRGMKMKKRKKKKRFIMRIFEVFKTAAETTAAVSSILGGWDKWRGLF